MVKKSIPRRPIKIKKEYEIISKGKNIIKMKSVKSGLNVFVPILQLPEEKLLEDIKKMSI
tara:strand:+ start:83 stop:262 length:180 start_codon:yes stop_codon:yes gene_type:complete